MIRFTAKISGEEEFAGGPHDAILPYWSFTKTLLAGAIFALARDGKVALDAPWCGKPFSLRQLLSHRAGVPNYGHLDEYHAAVGRSEDAWPLAVLLERTKADTLAFEPGTACAYSNIGYAYVRSEIEQQVGTNIDAAMQALLFEPLGVRDARFALSRTDMARMFWPALRNYDPAWVYHGLAVGTPLAAAQLLNRLMSTDFLPHELRKQMFRATSVGSSIPGRPFANPSLGTGIMIGSVPTLGLCAGHTGGGPGSGCAVYHFPELSPSCTAAAFSEGEEEGEIELAIVSLARRRG